MPAPRFHDLRHTWRTNARRSGVDYQIAEAIMGHWHKAKSVNDRYGRISDEELVNAVDLLTFCHGESEILVPEKRQKEKVADAKGNKRETKVLAGEVRKCVAGV